MQKRECLEKDLHAPDGPAGWFSSFSRKCFCVLRSEGLTGKKSEFPAGGMGKSRSRDSLPKEKCPDMWKWKRQQKALAVMLCFFGSFALCHDGAPAVQVQDDSGETIVLEKPAERVIPLYGAFAEILFAIGAGSGVIARTQADEHPEAIVRLPSVGTHMRPNVEMILGLKPDLVVQSASRREATAEMERLRAAGIPLAVFAPNSFQQLFSTMRRLGVLTGREEEALAKEAELRGRLEKATSIIDPGERRPRVFFEVRAEPLTGAGRGGIVQDILNFSGAENVLKSEKAIVQYGFESLLLDDPDIYIVQRGPMNRNPLPPAERAHFPRLRSIREGRVIFVDELLFSRPGPRCVDAVEQLAAELRRKKSP